MTTKGAFLKEKMQNMARWVEQEVGKENLSVDVIAGIAERTELEACTFAEMLRSNKTPIAQRNWSDLGAVLADRPDCPDAVYEVISRVHAKDVMHEKFWRYMDLFVEVASQ